ncbi:MAG: MATE family efflux transporter, partial [Clostridia bacterium]|nr:MATE family efflux transporter [Clostridia bacterium]
MKISRYLGDKPFWQTAARLALPIAIQNVLTSSFQLVDTMMVSRLGDLTLSSVGMAAQWGWMAAMLGFGLCSGMSVFISQYWGIKDLKGIRRVLGMGIATGLVMTLAFWLVAFCNPRFVIRLFNQDPAVLEIGCSYLSIVCFSYPAVVLTSILSTVLRNTERVKLPMYVSFFTTICNAVCNYALIFGKFGLPAMGVAGAAIATCISSWLGPVLLVIFSLAEKNILSGSLKEVFSFKLKNLGIFYQRAMPPTLNEGLWAIGTLVLNMIFSNQGYEYYAAVTIYRTFADLSFAFFVGLGNACVIMVGKSVGRGEIERGVMDARRFSVLVPILSTVIGLTVILLRYPLISIFSTGGTLSELTLATALAVTIFCSLENCIRNISYIQVVGIYRSGGDTLTGML